MSNNDDDGRGITDTIAICGDRLPYCRYHQSELTAGAISFTVVVEDTSAACVWCQEEENEHGE